jgi:hypothetical protein
MKTKFRKATRAFRMSIIQSLRQVRNRTVPERPMSWIWVQVA